MESGDGLYPETLCSPITTIFTGYKDGQAGSQEPFPVIDIEIWLVSLWNHKKIP